MKNVLFIAPPAGGKGTISEALEENFGYVHISTGDLLRSLDKSTPLGKEVNERLKTGGLLDDELVLRLLKEKLQTLDGQPFILDGCPRNIAQAYECEKIFEELNLSLDVVIGLTVPYDVVLKRAVGRVTCEECKAIFNKYTKPPVQEGICDKCGGTLVHRSDDNEETFKVRYDTFVEQTKPIVDFYKKANKYVEVDGLEGTYDAVVSVIAK